MPLTVSEIDELLSFGYDLEHLRTALGYGEEECREILEIHRMIEAEAEEDDWEDESPLT